MSNIPSLTAPAVTTVNLPPGAPPAGGTPTPLRSRLRAVRPDELPPAPDFLPPGATWLPAPGHVLPAIPGGQPMVGYLVLVPADRAPVQGETDPPVPPVFPDTAVSIDTERRTAQVDGRRLDLTYLEFELLAHLVAHPYRVHSRDQLVTTVWGYGHVGDGRTVDVHIARLRRKLGERHRAGIVTVRRVGYKYAPVSAAGATGRP